MASTYNPFAPKERSKVETPWGVFEVAPPNKARMLQMEALSKTIEALDDGNLAETIELAISIAACGVENGDELRDKLAAAWDAGEVTVDQVRGLADFVTAEIAGEDAAKND